MIEIFTSNLDKLELNHTQYGIQEAFFRLCVLAVRVMIYFVYVYENTHTSRIITKESKI